MRKIFLLGMLLSFASVSHGATIEQSSSNISAAQSKITIGDRAHRFYVMPTFSVGAVMISSVKTSNTSDEGTLFFGDFLKSTYSRSTHELVKIFKDGNPAFDSVKSSPVESSSGLEGSLGLDLVFRATPCFSAGFGGAYNISNAKLRFDDPVLKDYTSSILHSGDLMFKCAFDTPHSIRLSLGIGCAWAKLSGLNYFAGTLYSGNMAGCGDNFINKLTDVIDPNDPVAAITCAEQNLKMINTKSMSMKPSFAFSAGLDFWTADKVSVGLFYKAYYIHQSVLLTDTKEKVIKPAINFTRHSLSLRASYHF